MAHQHTTHPSPGPRVALVQDGARGHYGLALALQRAGMLEVMYTDFFIKKGGLFDRLSPFVRQYAKGPVRRLLDRKCDDLDSSRVETNLPMRIRQDRTRKKFPDDSAYFRWAASDVSRWIAPKLPGTADILLGFIRNLAPDLCAIARDHGMKTVGDQMIAPAFIEKRELALQHDRFPGWEDQSRIDYDEWIAYERDSWNLLDAITCPSDYVAEGLREAGISPDRIHVINYPIDETHFQFVDRSAPRDILTVGFVGQVILRKGVPYFMQMAKRFPKDKVRFIMLGMPNLTETALAELRQHVEVQPAPRSEVPAWLARFDLIYFPTTCEGSAYALMEAMATGLPIVTSPNSGTVARQGIEGFLCPYDDLDAAAGYIDRLLTNKDLRLSMGKAAAQRYRLFNMDKYTHDLAHLMNQLAAPAPVGGPA